MLGILLLSIGAILVGCDDQALGPEKRGDIRGEVQDARTNDFIARANVTTSPPTQSVLTNDEGMFELNGVEAGSYSVSVTKNGYEERSISVQVTEGDVSEAAVVLKRTDDFGPRTDSLDAEVASWFNDRINKDSTGSDSVYADVEYRAENTGDVLLTRYEVYFTIETSKNTFSYEVAGDSINPGETDVGSFRKYIRSSDADRVAVDGVYLETED